MIGFGGPERLRELAEELADLSLDARRAYLADLAKTDEAAVEQIKQALLALWRERDT